MKTYARIEDSRVVEIISLDVKPETLYHPSLAWVDITGQTEPPQINYTYNKGIFAAPILKVEDTLSLINSRLSAEMEKPIRT